MSPTSPMSDYKILSFGSLKSNSRGRDVRANLLHGRLRLQSRFDRGRAVAALDEVVCDPIPAVISQDDPPTPGRDQRVAMASECSYQARRDHLGLDQAVENKLVVVLSLVEGVDLFASEGLPPHSPLLEEPDDPSGRDLRFGVIESVPQMFGGVDILRPDFVAIRGVYDTTVAHGCLLHISPKSLPAWCRGHFDNVVGVAAKRSAAVGGR